MSALVAVPSRGRLRDDAVVLLDRAGYRSGALAGRRSSSVAGGLEFIEMRPADAASWLATGRLVAAFVSTDSAWENGIEAFPTIELGTGRSDAVVACREDASFGAVGDLDGAVVATHLPRLAARYFADVGVSASVVPMGGSLEGICAAGLADAIVDIRETGNSLVQNRLRVLATIRPCQALFVRDPRREAETAELVVRLEAALSAREHRYLMLHLPPEKMDALAEVFPGLAAPTVLPLAGRDDLVAVHLVVERDALWARLARLRSLGATGIVALATDAIVR